MTVKPGARDSEEVAAPAGAGRLKPIATCAASLPASHLDLAERPILGRLTTLLPDGYPQTHPVWFDFDGRCLRINTMREFRKTKNLLADPRVTMLLIDPVNTNRWMEVRGLVGLAGEGAMEHPGGRGCGI